MTLADRLAAVLQAISGRAPAAEEALRESESRFRQVTENIREVFFLVNTQLTRTFYISPGYAEIWGRSCESLYQDPHSFVDAIHVDDRERAIQAIAPHGTVIPCDVEYRIVRPDGTVRWIRARAFPIRDQSGDIVRFAGIAEDFTERKRAMDQLASQAQVLEQSNHRLSLLGEMTGLLQTVVRVEEAAAVVGACVAQVHLGAGGAIYLFRESRNSLDLLARWGDRKLPDTVVPDECWALRRGQPYRLPGTQPGLPCKHVQLVDGASGYSCLPMMAESGVLGLLHIVFGDDASANDEADTLFAQRMSEQLGLALANFRLREALRVEAMEDALTGLFNRRFLEITLTREFARAERDKTNVAVVMLDVDHFKRFNDAHGHGAGDIVLRQLGQVLTTSCRATDLASRFGGEEFALVVPRIAEEEMTAFAERLLGKIHGMRVVADGVVLPKLTVSIGIAFFPDHGKEAAEVIHAADQALYAAKQAGRDRYAFSSHVPGVDDGTGTGTRGGGE